MESNRIVQDLLSYVVYLPDAIVGLVGIILLLMQRQKLGTTAMTLGLLGFGLTVAIAVGSPLTRHLINMGVPRTSASRGQMITLFWWVSMVWGVARAFSYAFLLGAICVGRRSAPAPGGPPRFPS